jgi:hypothetical protein
MYVVAALLLRWQSRWLDEEGVEAKQELLHQVALGGTQCRLGFCTLHCPAHAVPVLHKCHGAVLEIP